MWQFVFYLNFVVLLYYAVFGLVIICFGNAIVVVNVFAVLLWHDLTTAGSRMNVWYH